jgi:hypothetical protein
MSLSVPHSWNKYSNITVDRTRKRKSKCKDTDKPVVLHPEWASEVPALSFFLLLKDR